MPPVDLGLLIVTLERRRRFFDRLMRCLKPQLNSFIRVYTLEDCGAETIGQKRQRMIESVQGVRYVAFIDDDDLLAPDYCRSILHAIDRDQPDVVGFRLKYFEDGKYKGHSMHSVRSKQWSTEMLQDGTAMHFRTPNHLNPIKIEMAREIGFKPLMSGEDSDYSERLFKANPMMNESFIDKVLYYYLYRNPSNRIEGENIAVPEVSFA